MKLLGMLGPDEQPKPRQSSSPGEMYPIVDDYIRNYEKNSFIQTVDDLERYAYHADLLKTINESRKNPQFEDSNGRNGLHCLAEVSFDLHLSGGRPSPIQLPDINFDYAAELEKNLEFLLEAGVDPNSHDKEGLTPFMAFVIHLRLGEDENLTTRPTRPLQRLFKAGADIHRRNRQGETALMISVKFGRRASTKFLLNAGSNVHVRANNGLGVVALGHKCAKRAKHNEALYAQIMLCVSLVVSAGAVSAPSILGEWVMRDRKEFPLLEDPLM
jgi:hypothetical protein